MMEQLINEGNVKIRVAKVGKISKKMPVFYNPIMRLNRDVSILLLNSLGKNGLQIADPLAGSGVRAIRFLSELAEGVIKNLSVNDISAEATNSIRGNLRLNGIEDNRILISNKDANLFLLESTGFDYIDIDPFGSPCPFLDAALKRSSRSGILAVTATDTSALAGSSKNACLRKYWAMPLRNEFMHETAIRILIRRVQLIGSEHEKALIPIFSYAKDHYYRVFFRCEKGREKADRFVGDHKFLIYNKKTLERRVSDTIFNHDKDCVYAGPLWTGQLWDSDLVGGMYENCDKKNLRLHTLLSLVKDECSSEVVGFYTIPELARLARLKELPKITELVNMIKRKGIPASRTHFRGDGLRTGMSTSSLIQLLKAGH